MHANGKGIAKNDVEAARWYRLAAEQGYAPAQATLGLLYFQGVGVPQNDAEKDSNGLSVRLPCV